MWWSVVGTGASSFVTCTDNKTNWGSLLVSFADTLRRQASVYQHLGTHPNIPTCHGLDEIHPGDMPPPVGVRLDMMPDAARALGHLHSLSLCDFDSSLMKGQAFDATNYEEAAYELPLRGRTLKGRAVTKRELFALGWLLYETMAWVKPFEGDGVTEIEESSLKKSSPARKACQHLPFKLLSKL
ncbi:hypothetical protein QBC33DRAFT_575648 [Phialemonium atrogriseum]|uniref:Protein kinase domain-containing protein n=1 Tax=Phialemonium atrogriseum TaxID=1093897 RepID=A0AAJ0C958_9PEZI|nr:uncharacterized protein QBC33DRAFT_575648 [Phialemonium atrogriseum]KAK1771827.1 hypothetical protein QBC33DRAFT_575648 [Phialemonium atrogriseum]